MQYKVFTIFDSKAECYLQPFFSVSKGDAIRAITNLVNDAQHNFGKYTEDFTLFEIGKFNNDNCTFELYNALMPLGNLQEFKKS